MVGKELHAIRNVTEVNLDRIAALFVVTALIKNNVTTSMVPVPMDVIVDIKEVTALKFAQTTRMDRNVL